MKQYVVVLLAAAAIRAQANAQLNNNTQATVATNNTAQVAPVVVEPAQVVPVIAVNRIPAPAVNVAAQNVVRINNDFLLQLIALKSIAMNMNNDNVLQQLITLHALWTNNADLRTLFQGIDLSAANIGLYYDASTQKFALIDLTNNTKTDIQALMTRLQALAIQKNANANANANVNANTNAVPTPSGLIGSLPIVGPLLTSLPIAGPLLKGLGN